MGERSSAPRPAPRVPQEGTRGGGLWVWVAGAGAGVAAAIGVTLVAAVLRDAFGIPTLGELVGDRVASLLPIGLFLTLLNLVGGFNNLKVLGLLGVFLAGVAGGGLLGALYALLVSGARSGARLSLPGVSGGGRAVVALLGACALVWLAAVGALWFVLPTSFHGLPPEQARMVSALTLLGLCLGFVPLLLLFRRLLLRDAGGAGAQQGRYGAVAAVAPDRSAPSRRGLLLAAPVGLLAVATVVQVGRLQRRATFAYDGMEYRGPDVQPVTPNDRFYSVTKNIVDPTVDARLWRLEVTGPSRGAATFSLGDVRGLPAVRQETTLMCISNRVGGGLMSNALWTGVPLARLLDPGGIPAGVREVVLRSVDGYTDTIPIEKAMHPTTLVAYEMNGEALPARHGFPARIIVPGLFGEKSVKWVTRIELAEGERRGFYEQQGWGPGFVIPTHSRFDVPQPDQELRAGAPLRLRGVAFGGNRGVSRVEVSTDGGGRWSEARLDYPGTPLSWALWSLEWSPPAPGTYALLVRAADGSGELQTATERDTAPQGATGYHRVTARVR